MAKVVDGSNAAIDNDVDSHVVVEVVAASVDPSAGCFAGTELQYAVADRRRYFAVAEEERLVEVAWKRKVEAAEHNGAVFSAWGPVHLCVREECEESYSVPVVVLLSACSGVERVKQSLSCSEKVGLPKYHPYPNLAKVVER